MKKFLRDGAFRSDLGIVNLFPSEGTHWVANTNQNYCNSYGFSPPQKLFRIIIKRIGHCSCCEYKKQGLESVGAFCLYIMYLTKR